MLLPAPLSPTSSVREPRGSARLMSCSTILWPAAAPYVKFRFVTSMTGDDEEEEGAAADAMVDNVSV